MLVGVLLFLADFFALGPQRQPGRRLQNTPWPQKRS